MRFNEHNRFALCKWTKIQNLTRVLIPTQTFMLFFFSFKSNIIMCSTHMFCMYCQNLWSYDYSLCSLALSSPLRTYDFIFSSMFHVLVSILQETLSVFVKRVIHKHLQTFTLSQILPISLSFALLIVLDSVIVSIVIHVRKFELSSYSKFIYNFSLKHQLIHSYNQS